MKLSTRGQHIGYGILGGTMGFCLNRIGFTDYGEVHNMFLFADLRLLFTFAGAVGLAMMGFFLLSGRLAKRPKTFHEGTIPGSILFGAGWALTGSCPSIAIVQLGEGQLPAVFTIFGIMMGAWMYRQVHAQFFDWDIGSCGE